MPGSDPSPQDVFKSTQDRVRRLFELYRPRQQAAIDAFRTIGRNMQREGRVDDLTRLYGHLLTPADWANPRSLAQHSQLEESRRQQLTDVYDAFEFGFRNQWSVKSPLDQASLDTVDLENVEAALGAAEAQLAVRKHAAEALGETADQIDEQFSFNEGGVVCTRGFLQEFIREHGRPALHLKSRQELEAVELSDGAEYRSANAYRRAFSETAQNELDSITDAFARITEVLETSAEPRWRRRSTIKKELDTAVAEAGRELDIKTAGAAASEMRSVHRFAKRWAETEKRLQACTAAEASAIRAWGEFLASPESASLRAAFAIPGETPTVEAFVEQLAAAAAGEELAAVTNIGRDSMNLA